MRKDVYIITGASSDIGVAFLRRLQTKCGVEDRICDIVAQYFSSAAVLEDLQKELPNLNIVPYQCDLANMKAVEAWLSLLQSEGIVPSHILHFASPFLIAGQILPKYKRIAPKVTLFLGRNTLCRQIE